MPRPPHVGAAGLPCPGGRLLLRAPLGRPLPTSSQRLCRCRSPTWGRRPGPWSSLRRPAVSVTFAQETRSDRQAVLLPSTPRTQDRRHWPAVAGSDAALSRPVTYGAPLQGPVQTRHCAWGRAPPVCSACVRMRSFARFPWWAAVPTLHTSDLSKHLFSALSRELSFHLSPEGSA